MIEWLGCRFTLVVVFGGMGFVLYCVTRRDCSDVSVDASLAQVWFPVEVRTGLRYEPGM